MLIDGVPFIGVSLLYTNDPRLDLQSAAPITCMDFFFVCYFMFEYIWNLPYSFENRKFAFDFSVVFTIDICHQMNA